MARQEDMGEENKGNGKEDGPKEADDSGHSGKDREMGLAVGLKGSPRLLLCHPFNCRRFGGWRRWAGC